MTPSSPAGDLVDLLAGDRSGRVSAVDVRGALHRCGLRPTDPRFGDLLDRLEDAGPAGVDADGLGALFPSGQSLLLRALQDRLVVPDFPAFRDEIGEIFEAKRGRRDGELAAYIPQLAKVDPERYGLSLCTIDGQRADYGDASTPFCVQSSFKPIGYAMALEERGEDLVHCHVGREPSGRSFNELALNPDGLPHNPLINAGAVMSCALVGPGKTPADRFESVQDLLGRMAGGERVGFSNPVYLAERETADRNYALGYIMRERRAFPEGTDLEDVLDLYFQCCAMEVTTSTASVVAATLANGGVCPTTEQRIFSRETVKRVLSLMLSCGMYDFSGEFAFSFGIPAKSGVSGVILGVVPDTLGFAVYSPRLDRIGNSVRGVEVIAGLAERFPFHMFDSLAGQPDKRDPRRDRRSDAASLSVQLIWAASVGDLDAVQRLASVGVPLDAADYDLRTPLHLAAAEGQGHVVRFLLGRGVDPGCADRWGFTPAAEAARHGHRGIAELLRAGRGDDGQREETGSHGEPAEDEEMPCVA